MKFISFILSLLLIVSIVPLTSVANADSPVNLALNKPAEASSIEVSWLTPDLAFDGIKSMDSRWSSQYSDPQWLCVDLEDVYNIKRIKLTWQGVAYATSYKIQVSLDKVNWMDVYSTTQGDGDVDDIEIEPTDARYVRMYGTVRNSQYGYSIQEFEVYDTTETTDQVAHNIIPRPLSYVAKDGNFKLLPSTDIYVKGNNAEETAEIMKIGQYLADKLEPATGFDIDVLESDNPPEGSIYLTTVNGNDGLGDEGYELDVDTEGVVMRAYKPEGLFRGIQTIRQMLPAQIERSVRAFGVKWLIPCASIYDKPAYEWRGFMLDEGRHFFGVEEVKRQLDLMAQYKMNVFHWHLTDDQGWRIEIKSMPNLAVAGGQLDYHENCEGGYYTQEEYTEIINYAKERYITVVPEIDMPGHNGAAIKAYPELGTQGGTELNVYSEATYKYIDKVIKEIAELTPGQYIHIGGDEAYTLSRDDFLYFINRAVEIVKKYGKTPIGWNDWSYADAENVDSNSVVQFWIGSYTTALEKGVKLINSNCYKAYLPHKYYESYPRGATWAGYTNTQDAYEWDPADMGPKEQVLGLECALWTERVDSVFWMDNMVYPRLPGYAEVGWTPKELRDWDEYKYRLAAHGPRMEYQGIQFFADPIVPWVESESLVGDINLDGKINVADLAITSKYYGYEKDDAGWENASRADVNNDDRIDIEDMTFIANIILSSKRSPE